MPAPSSVSLYPSQWLLLIQQVSAMSRSVTVAELAGRPMTKGQACQLRFKFYHIRQLLHKDPQQQELARLADCVQATITHLGDEKWSITFSPRDRNAEAIALEKALEVNSIG